MNYKKKYLKYKLKYLNLRNKFSGGGDDPDDQDEKLCASINMDPPEELVARQCGYINVNINVGSEKYKLLVDPHSKIIQAIHKGIRLTIIEIKWQYETITYEDTFKNCGIEEDATLSVLAAELYISNKIELSKALREYRNGSEKYGPITNWNTSAVTDMSNLFDDNSSFNLDISKWDTSAVENMSNMFSRATDFNQDIGDWDTSSVTNMSYMFYRSNSFNQDISKWDTSAVENMSYMFSRAVSFNNGNKPLKWMNTGAVTNMSNMFGMTTDFNQDIGDWDTSAVTNMSFMFYRSNSFNQDISKWDTSAVTDMSGMFSNAVSFNQDISKWDTSAVTNMDIMFANTGSFNQDISMWDTSAVENMSGMFMGTGFFNQEIKENNITLPDGSTRKAWNTRLVTKADRMFMMAIALKQKIVLTFDNKANINNIVEGAGKMCTVVKVTEEQSYKKIELNPVGVGCVVSG